MKQILLVCLLLCAVRASAQSKLYQEEYRPQFHFSPEKGWMNDPNGLIYYKGEYHLFYQYNPDSTVWGPMHWGHAISRDLVHWEQLPIALFPDEKGYIFSGSIVLDKGNTSGFGKPNSADPPMVAIFTYHNMEWERAGRKDRESQAIAYSLDKGRTWTKYEGNPVLPNKGDVDFRDPKVFWHQPTKHWIMPLAVGDHLEIFISKNLKAWEKASEFGKNEGAHGGVWECPDLFELPSSGGKKWVLIQNMGRGAINGGSGTQYFIGSFDGKVFTNSNPPSTTLWLDYGADNYAGITWNGNIDGRKLFIGWMSNWDDYATKVPTSTWRSAMTIPRSLKLSQTAEGFRLTQTPIKELDTLRTSSHKILNRKVNNSLAINNLPLHKEMNLSFDLSDVATEGVGIELSNSEGEKLIIGYDNIRKEVYIDRTKAGKNKFSTKFARKHIAPYKATKIIKMQLFVDASSVELFVDNGKIAMTETFYPSSPLQFCHLFSKGAAAKANGEVFGLKSIWQKN
jgi:fructan beta-fructosidase